MSRFIWIKIIQFNQCSPIPEQMTLISQLFSVNQNQCNPITEPITIMNRFLSVNQNHIAQPVIQLQNVTPVSHSFCSPFQWIKSWISVVRLLSWLLSLPNLVYWLFKLLLFSNTYFLKVLKKSNELDHYRNGIVSLPKHTYSSVFFHWSCADLKQPVQWCWRNTAHTHLSQFLRDRCRQLMAPQPFLHKLCYLHLTFALLSQSQKLSVSPYIIPTHETQWFHRSRQSLPVFTETNGQNNWLYRCWRLWAAERSLEFVQASRI